MRQKVAIGISLVGFTMLMYSRYCRGKTLRVSKAAPEQLQVWEGEGGGVPVGPTRTAAQVHSVPASPALRL